MIITLKDADYAENNIGTVTQMEMGTIMESVWLDTATAQNQSMSNWCSTDYLTIPDNASLITTDDIIAFRKIDYNSTTPLAFYDANKNYICGISEEIIPEQATSTAAFWRNALTAEVPSGAKYVRVCWSPISGYANQITGKTSSITQPTLYYIIEA